jgi:hypothetical protein
MEYTRKMQNTTSQTPSTISCSGPPLSPGASKPKDTEKRQKLAKQAIMYTVLYSFKNEFYGPAFPRFWPKDSIRNS